MRRAPWTSDEDAALRELYPAMPNREAACELNRRFGTRRTEDSVLGRARALGLRKPPGYRKPHPVTFWTEGKVAWFREFVPGRHESEISAEHERIYGTPLTSAQIGNAKSKFGVRSGTRGGAFEKGKPPWNKGMSWDEYMSPEGQEACRATQFKSGEVHGSAEKRLKPVGTERVNRDGYIEVKVRDSRVDGPQANVPGRFNENWRLKHRVEYERAYGSIPRGCNVVFADRDKRNFDPANLVAVPRDLWAVISREGWAYRDRESLEACVNLARLGRAAYAARLHPRACKKCGAEFRLRYPHQRTCDGCLALSRREC